jgi:hypothetical protein
MKVFAYFLRINPIRILNPVRVGGSINLFLILNTLAQIASGNPFLFSLKKEKIAKNSWR